MAPGAVAYRLLALLAAACVVTQATASAALAFQGGNSNFQPPPGATHRTEGTTRGGQHHAGVWRVVWARGRGRGRGSNTLDVNASLALPLLR